MKLRLATALLALSLAGCGSHAPRPPGDDASRPLLAPAALGAARTATQIVRGAFGEREMTMTCVVSVKDGAMSIVGLSAMGVRLFTIRFDGRETSVENTVPVPAQLTPERLIADLQLVYWPTSALEPALRDAGWRLSEPAPSTRRLRHDGRLIAEVHYTNADPWSGRAWLVNLEHDYTLNIESTTN